MNLQTKPRTSNLEHQTCKILMPVLHYPPVIGGLEVWTQNIAERLSDKIDIFVVTGKVKNQPLYEEKRGVKIWRTSLFVLKNLSYSSLVYVLTALPFIFLKSLDLIKKEKINLLHCQGFLSAFLGYILSKITKIPYIVTVQRLEEKGFFKKLIYKKAEVCIAASRAIEKYFRNIGVKEIKVIPNGIDLERFKNINREEMRRKLGVNNKFLIMSIARLEKVKGIRYLIEAISILSAKNKIPGIKCFIIGEGSDRERLEGFIKELGSENRISLLGEISPEEIPKYLISADCFVLPSVKEGFGIVVLEAMASNVPVIATKIGGILDIIKDRENGILVHPENSEEIAEAVFQIYSNPNFAIKLVENAKEKLENYNWQNIVQRINKIYLEAI